MNNSFNNSQSGQPLYFNNSTSTSGTNSTAAAGASTGATASVSDPQSNNNPNIHNNNSNNHANSVLNNTRASSTSNNNHHVNTGDHTNGHMSVSNNQLRNSTSRHPSNESINPENEAIEMNPSSNALTGQPTSNDFYQLIGQLQQQNTINNQLMMKINYLSDSVDEVKRSLSDIQQSVYTLQNNGPAAAAAMGGAFTGNVTNQFKAFEVFTKHLTKLNKEIEAINVQNSGGQSIPQHQLSRQQSQQPHQSHPHSSQQHVNTELQSQNHLSVANNSIAHDNSLHHNQAQSTNNQPFDDDADLGRKNVVSRSPGVNSNSTSPYVFELGGFPTVRNNLNGNINYDKSPIASSQIPHQLKRSQQTKQSMVPSTQPQQQIQTLPQQQLHVAQHGQSQRPPSLAQHSQQQLHTSNHSSVAHPQQASNTFSNSYMLPVPPLLHDDKTGGLTQGADSSSQYLLSRDNSGLLTSALRQQASHTRSIPPQANTAFSFDDNDIEQSIGELEQQTGSSASSAHNATANSTQVNVHKQLSDKPYPSKKRKVAPEIKSGDLEETEVPQYKLERSLKSIADIWKEFAYGVNGKPPLKSLEAKYGTKWRNETESRTFLRRKKIYEAIEVGKSKGYSEDDVILELEDYRSFEKNGSLKKKPLSWVSSNIPEKFTEPGDE
ncbi:HOT1 [Candida margitis]|uniref:HOT1 n=1 Tax=Candida margitis TaxID=1775924 RepID=UPI002227DBBB|nr:HOT1 [Candida margitis]KAI5961784.1 HOT1 [Candida margitis]